jgi:hypothetical protein
MSDEAMRFCTECGARIPVRPFCTQCGAALAPLAPTGPAAADAGTAGDEDGPVESTWSAAPPPEPTYDYLFTPPPAPSPTPSIYAPPPPDTPLPTIARSRPDPPRSGGSGRVVVAVLMALLLLGGAAGAWLLLSDDAEPSVQGTRTTPSSAPSTEDPGAVSEDPAPTETQPSTSPTATDEPSVRCWDGSRSADKASCPPLTGESAVRWVFPSIDRFGGCRLGASGDPAGVANQYVCDIDSDGSAATIYYREWASSADAESFYSGKYGVEGLPIYGPDGTLVFHQWESRATGEAVRLFVRAPFSASVSVGSEAPVEVLRNPNAVNYVHANKLP